MKVWVFLFIFLIINISGVFAISFEERANIFVNEIKGNFSFPHQDLKIKFDDVDEESAESIRYPIFGYIITLDPVKLENTSDAELKGLLAHELSHLEIYSRMNWFQLGFYGLHYLTSHDFRRQVERGTDIIAINKGFGRELEAFREFRLKTGNEHDKQVLREDYLSPEEIKNLIEG